MTSSQKQAEVRSDSGDDSEDEDLFFWGCTLTRERPIVEWTGPEDDSIDDSFASNELHGLCLKQAVLGVGAVPGERNIVYASSENYSEENIDFPILSLELNRNDMCTLDMTFQSPSVVVFRLGQGRGPVHLTGEHHVLYLGDECDDEDTPSPSPRKAKQTDLSDWVVVGVKRRRRDRESRPKVESNATSKSKSKSKAKPKPKASEDKTKSASRASEGAAAAATYKMKDVENEMSNLRLEQFESAFKAPSAEVKAPKKGSSSRKKRTAVKVEGEAL